MIHVPAFHMLYSGLSPTSVAVKNKEVAQRSESTWSVLRILRLKNQTSELPKQKSKVMTKDMGFIFD